MLLKYSKLKKNNFKNKGEIIDFKYAWIYSCWYGISDPYLIKGLTIINYELTCISLTCNIPFNVRRNEWEIGRLKLRDAATERRTTIPYREENPT